MTAFRSLTIAFTAIVLNLLSVGASYGVMVLVFQHHWFDGILGYTSTGTIATWIPLFMFAILFGLSMDYHVFILSRVVENRRRGHVDRTTPSSTASRRPPASSRARPSSWSRCSRSSARCRRSS